MYGNFVHHAGCYVFSMEMSGDGETLLTENDTDWLAVAGTGSQPGCKGAINNYIVNGIKLLKIGL